MAYARPTIGTWNSWIMIESLVTRNIDLTYTKAADFSILLRKCP